MSWTQPVTNGSAITDYDVQYRACTATDGDTAVLTCATNPTWETTWSDRSGETASDTSTSVTVTGLTNNTAYQVQVRAANSIGESGWSASATGTPYPKPAKPTDLALTPGHQSIQATWTAPSGPVTGYRVKFQAKNPNTGNWLPDLPNTRDYGGSTTTVNMTDGGDKIANGWQYRVAVSAKNNSGWSSYTDYAFVWVAAKPPTPTGVTLTVGDSQLGVSWTSPTNNSGAAITDYDVQYRACTATNSDTTVLTCATSPTWGTWTEWNASDTSTTTSATITGLTNDTAYQVQARSTNSTGDSAWSSAASATPAKKPDAPGAPTLTVKNESLEVSWTAPDDNGASITDYDVQYRACTATPLTCTTSPTWGDWNVHAHTGTGTAATITGLTNNTAYQVQVRATNSQGTSGWSAASAKAVPVPQKPDAPSSPTMTVWNKELRVSWTAPADNGATITDYDVQYRACTAAQLSCANNPTWGNWTEWNASDTSTTRSAIITGLTNDTAYLVQVRAGNSVGDGAWSLSTKAIPTAQKPAKPGAPTLTHKSRSLDVSWTAPADNGAAITGYRVRHCDNSKDCSANSTNWTPKDVAGAGTSTTITGLTNGTTYQVQVRATNSVGNGQFSASATEYPSAVPSAPAAPTLTFKDQALDVSWSAPSSDNGAAITGYKVGRCSANCDNADNWTVATLTGTGTTHTLSGLTNGTTYQVRVAATNRSGDSAWSATASESPAYRPATPAKPTVTRGNQSVTVSWTARPTAEPPSATTTSTTASTSRTTPTGRHSTIPSPATAPPPPSPGSATASSTR